MGAFLSRVFAALLGRGCRQPGPFSYAGPLDSKSIRLLQLRRPKWYWYAFRVTKPALSMGTYRTDSLPKYVALSYTWGPPQQDAFGYGSNDKVPFLINGRIFPLFRNLGNALGSLHRAWDFDDDVQHLWVDAICINQHDEAERASQVSIMDRIYRGAASTCVWLGEESRSQTRAPIFRNILNTPSEDFVPYYHQYPSGTPPADGFWQSKGLPCPDDEEQWAPVRRLFQNQWFSRAWIIQEVLLSRNIYVCWGSTWMTWDDLGKMALVGHVAKLGQHSALPLLFQHLSGEGTHSEPQDWAVHDPVTIALQLWLNGHRYSQQTPLAGKVMQGLVDEMQALCGSAVVTPTSWLMYFCLTNRWADATEPQDKVFAFLGLANNLTEPGTEPCPIIPTYSPEVTHLHIYEQCMRRLIEETDSLDVFMAINDPPAARDPLLPSWVPDLSRRQGLDLMWSIRPRFRAHGGDSSLVPGSSVSSERESESKTPAASRRLQIEGPCLLARGTLIATITRRGPSSIDLLGPNWYCWFSQLLELDPVYSLTGESRVEAFWRTLLMNSVAKRHPAEWPESTDVPGRADTEKQLHPFRAHVLQVLARSYPGPDPEADRDGHESYQREMASLTKLSEEDFSGHMPSFRGRGDLISQFTDTPVDEAEALSHEAVLAALTACMERASAFLIGMDASMVNRVVAFSSGGHIVNAPMWTEEGDGIFILDSCPCPLVLRPQPGQAGCYTLVGPAYVHGIMYGEAVNEETQWAEVCIQ